MKTKFRLGLQIVCAMAMLPAGLITAQAGNLLLNASIENGTSSTQIDNWTAHAGDTFRETTNAFGFTGPAMHDGLYAVKEFGGEGDLAQSNIAVLPGVFYDVSGWFYHSSSADVISNNTLSTRMFMHVEWFDSSNSSLRNDYTANHNGTSPADSWNQITAQFLSPATADHATFHVESDHDFGGGSVFGDDFTFIPETSMVSLLVGGGMLLRRTRRISR
jgi:hypothetical protein